MTVIFIRLFFVFLGSIIGYYVGWLIGDFNHTYALAGAGVGFFGALLVIFVEIRLRRLSVRNLSAAVFGLIFGFFMAWLLTLVIRLIPMDEKIYSAFNIIFVLVFCYLGMVIAMRGKDEFNLIIPYVRFSRQEQKDEIIILDTSVIIDGRIIDIAETRFIEGRFIVPRFVLRELQQIADSQDALKRNRGRRGLDILNRLQKGSHIGVKIHDEDFPEVKDVDAKIIKLARFLNAKVITNDFNLNKIAELQGVTVLNINDLANALKPVVLPGEEMRVRITKEGKEYNQGVAYLDDGTMIVVDNGRHLIGQTINVVVTSVLQTSAGRMIFANRPGANLRRESRGR
ncbi:MAG: TRAM domain-containing protein [Candidatus Omnitrophota bacterium]|nr:MAG: TRAM domain-containing protein [Candidatus Omnitrophota bacterium]